MEEPIIYENPYYKVVDISHTHHPESHNYAVVNLNNGNYEYTGLSLPQALATADHYAKILENETWNLYKREESVRAH